MRQLIFTTFLFLLNLTSGFLSTPLQAQGYAIEIELDNFKAEQLFMARYLKGGFVYQDTLLVKKDQPLIFSGDTSLEEGVYLAVVPPKMKAIQFFVTTDNQTFKLKGDAQSIIPQKVSFEGHELNSAYYHYLTDISDRRKAISELFKEKKEASKRDRKKLDKKIDKAYLDIREVQQKIRQQYPNTWLAHTAQIDMEPIVPEPKAFGFDEDNNESRAAALHFRNTHFFDEIDFDDLRNHQNPRYFSKLNLYINYMLPQEPDSVSKAIDTLLAHSENNPELYEASLNYFLKVYDRPRVIGMDAVYVHLAKNYHAKGKTPWLPEADIKRITIHGRKLDRILIGKTAPNLTWQDRAGKPITLSDIEADYLILFFWRPGCGHCKKSMPKLKDFYNKYKDKNVEVLAVCTNVGQSANECWDFVDDKEIKAWINAVDPRHKSKFLHVYNAARTPKLYVLDRDKTIISKDIGVESLEGVLKRLDVIP